MPTGAKPSPASGRPTLMMTWGKSDRTAIYVAGNADDSGFQSPDEDRLCTAVDDTLCRGSCPQGGSYFALV